MNNKSKKYFVSVMLIFILFAKDMIMTVPVLIPGFKMALLHEDWTSNDSEKTKSAAEENIKAETEGYIFGHCFLNADSFLLNVSKEKEILVNTSLRQTFYPSVSTPPPDFA